jgi:hypothetical protein
MYGMRSEQQAERDAEQQHRVHHQRAEEASAEVVRTSRSGEV